MSIAFGLPGVAFSRFVLIRTRKLGSSRRNRRRDQAAMLSKWFQKSTFVKRGENWIGMWRLDVIQADDSLKREQRSKTFAAL